MRDRTIYWQKYFLFDHPSCCCLGTSLGIYLIGIRENRNFSDCSLIWFSLVAQTVKNLPAMKETQGLSLGREDPLERREWQPTPVFLPGEFHGQRSLAGYSPWGCKESDTAERLTHIHTHSLIY